MGRYRKKPVVVKAEQFFPNKKPWPEGLESNWDNHPTTSGKVTIQTLEGRMEVSPGDWIITGVKGERYPCKPDIFEATYEPVDWTGLPLNPSSTRLLGRHDTWPEQFIRDSTPQTAESPPSTPHSPPTP